MLLNAILKTPQVFLEVMTRLARQTIDPPVQVLAGFNEAVPLEIVQMLRNLNLGFAQDGLKMTNTKRAAGEEIEDPKAGLITEALVNLNQGHPG